VESLLARIRLALLDFSYRQLRLHLASIPKAPK
jgi:hypothetical protein